MYVQMGMEISTREYPKGSRHCCLSVHVALESLCISMTLCQKPQIPHCVCLCVHVCVCLVHIPEPE